MKCQELQIWDWITDGHGLPMQITNVGDDYAYATFEGNEGEPWEFDDKEDSPEPILITPEILEKNGWVYTEYCHEYQDGKIIIQSRPPYMWIRINGINIEAFKCEYVHQYQHLLRLFGLDELANNFKVV